MANLATQMRFLRALPAELDQALASVQLRNARLAALLDLLDALPATELADCFCELSDKAGKLPPDLGGDDDDDGGGGDDAPGDGSDPGGGRDPDADPTKLRYGKCWTFSQWQFLGGPITSPPNPPDSPGLGYYYHRIDLQNDHPPTETDVLYNWWYQRGQLATLEPNRWYAISTAPWPDAHFAVGFDSALFDFGVVGAFQQEEPGGWQYRYWTQEDFDSYEFELWLLGAQSPNSLTYTICAADIEGEEI